LKKIKAMSTITAVSLATILTFTGCSSGNNSASSIGNEGAKPTVSATPVVTAKNDTTDAKKGAVSVDFYMDKVDWAANLDKVGALAAQSGGAGFKSVTFSDTTSYQTTIKQSLAGNNPPDILSWWSGFRMEDMVKSGAIADMTDEWKKYQAEGLNQDLAKAFTFNGKIYGAPMYVAYWNVFYNKKVFDQYGLKPPKTWDEFMNVVKTLKDKGVTPLANPFEGRWPSFIWFEEFLVHSNPDLYEKLMVGEASYTDPGVVEAMKLWKSFIDAGYFGKPGDLSKELLPDFAQGKTGMYLIGQWFSSSLLQSGLKAGEDYDAFILPAIKDGVGNVAIYETAPIMVADKGKHKNDAFAAIQNFYKKDTQQLWSESQGFAPLLPGVQSKNAVTDKVFNDIQSSKYRLVQRYWEATPPDISEFAVDQFSKFILDPTKYMEVLQTIDDHAKKYWASRK